MSEENLVTDRPTIRLGKVSQRAAESVKFRVEQLLAAKLTGHAIENPWGPRIGIALQGAHLLGDRWLRVAELLGRRAVLGVQRRREPHREQRQRGRRLARDVLRGERPVRHHARGQLGHAGPLPLSNVDDTATPTDNLAPSTASGAGAQFLQPLQMADLLVGFGIGETSLLGARLSIGQNTFRENRLGIDLDDDESWNTTAINLGLGYSMRGPLYLDLNLELGLAFFSNVYHTDEENEPNYNDSGSLAPSFSLSGRSFVPLQESVNLGILGIVHVNSASVTNEFGTAPDSTTTADEAAASSSNFFFEAGAGPMYDLADGTQIAGYGTVGFGSSSHTDESQTLKTSALLLPGFKLALEHWMLDWLAFRTGLSSRYYFGFQSREFEDDSRANVSATASSYEFLWSVGLGVELGNFELNGTVQTPFVTGGPHFIGGTAPGLFALLNATYLF